MNQNNKPKQYDTDAKHGYIDFHGCGNYLARHINNQLKVNFTEPGLVKCPTCRKEVLVQKKSSGDRLEHVEGW